MGWVTKKRLKEGHKIAVITEAGRFEEFWIPSRTAGTAEEMESRRLASEYRERRRKHQGNLERKRSKSWKKDPRKKI